MPHLSESLENVQAIRFGLRVSDTLERRRMETKGERRLRKLRDLCSKHGGHLAVADKSGVNEQYLDQILKGVLLPKKADGSRSPRILGDAVARKIEAAFDLGSGWFDSEGTATELPSEIHRLAARLASIADDATRASIVQSMTTQINLALDLQEQRRAPGTPRIATYPDEAPLPGMESKIGNASTTTDKAIKAPSDETRKHG